MNSDVSLSCVCLFNTYIGHAQQPQTTKHFVGRHPSVCLSLDDSLHMEARG